MSRREELTMQDLTWRDEGGILSSSPRGQGIPTDTSMEALQHALDEEVDLLRRDKHFYQNCFKQAQRELDELKSTRETEIIELRKHNVESKIEIELLQNRLHSMKIELQKANAKSNSLLDEVSQLREANASLQQNLGGHTELFYDSKLQMEASIRTITDEKVQLSNALKKQDVEIRQLRQDKLSLSTKVQALEAELRSSHEETSRAKEQHNVVHIESSTMSSRLVAAEKELTRITEDRNRYNKLSTDLQASVLELEGTLSSLRIKYAHLEREKVALDTELKIASEKNDAREEELSIRNAEYTALQLQLVAERTKVAVGHEELTELRSRLSEQQEKINTLLSEKFELETLSDEQRLELVNCKHQLQTLHDNVLFLENEMAAEVEVKNALLSEKSLLQSTVETLENLLESDNDALTTLIEEKNRMTLKHQSVLTEIGIERERNIALTAELIKCKERLSALESELAAKESCIESLTSELESATDSLRIAQPSLEALQREMETQSTLHHQLTIDFELIKQSKEILEIDCSRLRDANAVLTSETQSLRNATTKALADLTSLEGEFNAAQISLSNATESIKFLTDKNNSLESEIIGVKEERDKITRELQHVQDTMKTTIEVALTTAMTTSASDRSKGAIATDNPESTSTKDEHEGDIGESQTEGSIFGDDHVNQLQLLVDEEIDVLEVNNAMLRSKLERMSFELNNALSRLEQTTEEKTGLIERSQTMTEVLYSMQSSKIQVDIELVSANTKIKEYETLCESYRSHNVQQQDEIEELQTTNSQLLREIALLEEDVEALREAQIASDQDSLQKLDALESELKQLKKSEQDTYETLTEVRKDKTALMSSLVQLQREKQELISAMDSLVTKHASTLAETENKHREILTQESSSWESMEDLYQQRLQSSEVTITSLNSTVESLEQLRVDSETRVTQLRSEVSLLRETISNNEDLYNNEIQALREALRAAECNHKTTISALMETMGLSESSIQRILGETSHKVETKIASTPSFFGSNNGEYSNGAYISKSDEVYQSTNSVGRQYVETQPITRSTGRFDGVNSKASKLWHYGLLKEIVRQLELFRKAQETDREIKRAEEWEKQLLSEIAAGRDTMFMGSPDAADYSKDRQLINAFGQLYQRRTELSQELDFISRDVQNLVADTETLMTNSRQHLCASPRQKSSFSETRNSPDSSFQESSTNYYAYRENTDRMTGLAGGNYELGNGATYFRK